MKKLLSILILSIFLISLTSALESLGTFKQNECVRISQICNDATYINISSITNPSSTKLLNETQMIYDSSGEFYYNFCDTLSLGRYDIRGISDGCENTFATYFEVTKSGKTISFNLFLPLVVILFFSMLCFIFGVTSKENKIMKYTLFSLAVVMAYVGIQYTLIVVQDYSLIGETEGGLGFFLTFFQAITWIIGGIFTLVIIWLFLQLRKWFNIKKGFIDGGNYR